MVAIRNIAGEVNQKGLDHLKELIRKRVYRYSHLEDIGNIIPNIFAQDDAP